MKIEITDIPNGQLIKDINLQIHFENGQVQQIQEIQPIQKEQESNTSTTNTEIPNEMLSGEF